MGSNRIWGRIRIGMPWPLHRERQAAEHGVGIGLRPCPALRMASCGQCVVGGGHGLLLTMVVHLRRVPDVVSRAASGWTAVPTGRSPARWLAA